MIQVQMNFAVMLDFDESWTNEQIVAQCTDLVKTKYKGLELTEFWMSDKDGRGAVCWGADHVVKDGKRMVPSLRNELKDKRHD